MSARYTGIVKSIGDSTLNNIDGSRFYSHVEIGENLIRNVRVSDQIATKLTLGEEVEFELADFRITIAIVLLFPFIFLYMTYGFILPTLLLVLTSILFYLVVFRGKLDSALRPVKFVKIKGQRFRS